MLITDINFKNFKPFKDVSFELNSHFNIIIGKNMSGKTSVLDGLSVAMGAFFFGMSGGTVKDIEKKDIRLTTYKYSLEEQIPVYIGAKGTVDAKNVEWNITKTTKYRPNEIGYKTIYELDKIRKIAKQLHLKIQQGENIKLPILAYYPTDRTWYPIDNKDIELEHKGSRLLGYKSWANPEINYKMLLRWFKTMELATIQKKKNGMGQESTISLELQVLKSCLINCIESAKNIFFDWEYGELILEWQDDRKIPVSRLSHGVKNMMAIIADIAYRCMRLNPHLELNAAKETEGIVLIDELDAHLHPSWQLKIVDNLKKTFPKIQFVITTHSPLIIGSADVNELIMLPENLSEGSFKPEEKSYKGWQLQFILEQIMDSESNYDVNIAPILNNLSENFEKNDLENYQKNLVVLKNVLNPNDAILKIYQMKLAILL